MMLCGMAFIAAMVHGVGAYYPDAGIDVVPRTLERAATEAGV